MRRLLKKLSKHSLILIVVLLAFLIRLGGFDFGLPNYHFNSDEPLTIHDVGSLFAGKPRERTATLYGEFFSSVTEIVLKGEYLLTSFFNNSDKGISKKILFSEFIDPHVYQTSRILSALFCTLSVLFIYLIGKILWKNTLVGLAGALIFTFVFIDVQYSHYAKMDSLALLTALISFYFCIKLFISGKRGDYIKAGFFAGLAISSYKPNFFILFVLLFAHLLRPNIKFSKKIKSLNFFLSILFVLIAHLIAAPNSLLLLLTSGMPENLFLQAFREKTGLHLSAVSMIFLYLKYLWVVGFGWSFCLLFIFGLYFFVKDLRKNKALWLIIIAVSFYILPLTAMKTTHDRYTKTLLAFFSLIAALPISNYCIFLKNKMKENRIYLLGIFSLLAVVFYSPIKKCVTFDYSLIQKDTREVFEDWLERNINKDKLIFVDGGSLVGTFPLYNKGYNIISGDLPKAYNFDYLAKFKGEYIVVAPYNSLIYSKIDPERTVVYEKIKENFHLIHQVFNPLFESDYFGDRTTIFFTVYTYHNQRMEIYQIPEGVKKDKYSFVYLPEEMIQAKGELVEDKDLPGEKALFFKEQGGVSGPHLPFPKGTYLVDFYLKVLDNTADTPIVSIWVSTSGGGKTFIREGLKGTDFLRAGIYQKFTLPLELEHGYRLEFVVQMHSQTKVYISRIELRESIQDEKK